MGEQCTAGLPGNSLLATLYLDLSVAQIQGQLLGSYEQHNQSSKRKHSCTEISARRASQRENQAGSLDDCCCFCYQHNGDERRGPRTLVSSLTWLCRTFPNIKPTQDPLMCSLFASGVSVQATAKGRGPNASSTGFGSISPHQKHRTGPQPLGESGERSVGKTVDVVT